jgi:carbon-monoxide dehydrogenase medium subunit
MNEMRDFDYLEPTNITEAVALLERLGEEARIVAGGTDLLVSMKQRVVSPRYLVSTRRIPRLNFIETSDDGSTRVGASTPFSVIETSTLIRENFGILAQAAGLIGSHQIRNLATIGGNICHASPSADSVPALLTLNATVALVSPQGRREISLESFFEGPGETALRTDEIMTAVHLPPLPKNSNGKYMKLSYRRAMDLAILGVGIILVMDDENEICREARIGLGGVAPTAIRAKESEIFLIGKSMDSQTIKNASWKAVEETKAISDIRASAYYRREMTTVLIRRILESLIGHA